MNFIDKIQFIIRQLLANSKVPLQDIAEQSGLELEHLQKVISGEDPPRFEDMDAVLEALGIDDIECLELVDGHSGLDDKFTNFTL